MQTKEFSVNTSRLDGILTALHTFLLGKSSQGTLVCTKRFWLLVWRLVHTLILCNTQIQVVNENPLYVLLDTSEGAGLRDLPIQVLRNRVFSA